MHNLLARTALWGPAWILLLAFVVVAQLPAPLPGLSTVTTILWLLGSGAAICLLLRRMIDADDRARAAVAELTREWKARAAAESSLADTENMLVKLARQQETLRASERGALVQLLDEDLGQTLLSLRVELSLLQAASAGVQPSTHQRAAGMIIQLDQALASLQRDVLLIRPLAPQQTLSEAVTRQLEQFTQLTGIAHMLDISPEANAAHTCDDHAALLYRVLQQALADRAQRANASVVRVVLVCRSAQLHLCIEDDGSSAPCPCGLAGLRERVRRLGGELEQQQAPAGGATLELVLPTTHQRCAA